MVLVVVGVRRCLFACVCVLLFTRVHVMLFICVHVSGQMRIMRMSVSVFIWARSCVLVCVSLCRCNCDKVQLHTWLCGVCCVWRHPYGVVFGADPCDRVHQLVFEHRGKNKWSEELHDVEAVTPQERD